MIVPYTPQHLYQKPDTGGERLKPGDFGGSAAASGQYARGAQLKEAGRNLQIFGSQVQAASDKWDEVVARDAFTRYQAQSLQKKQELEQLKGENALGKSDGSSLSVTQDFSQWTARTRAAMTGEMSSWQKELFAAQADRYDMGLGQWAFGYEQRQRQVYEDSVDEGAIAVNQDLMLQNPLDMAAVRIASGKIRDAYKRMGERNGWDIKYIEAALHKTVRGAIGKMISAQLDAENVNAAQSLLERYGSELGGAQGAVRAHIAAKGRELAARGRAEQERASREQASLLGNALFMQYRMDAEAARNEITQKVTDPVQQERVLQSYLTRSSLEERLQKQSAEQARAAEYTDAIHKSEAVLTNQSLTDKPAALADLLGQISDPAIHKQVSEYIEFRINGTEAPVDRNVLADAQTYAAQPGVRPDMVTSRYASKLPPSALQKAVNIASDQATKQSEKLMQDEITESLVDDFGYSRAQATAGYRVILSRMTGLTDPAQRLERARMLAREISVKNDAWFSGSGWGSGVTIPAYDLQRMQREDPSFHLVEVPKEAIPWLDQRLASEGYIVNEENRLIYYNDWLGGKVK